jgi:hypothetical protein
MTDVREINESGLKQGADEEITYQLTTTPWGSSPGSVVVQVFDVTAGGYTDVSSTVLSGAASLSGDEITLPVLGSLTVGHVYRLEVRFTCGSNVFETWMRIEAEA